MNININMVKMIGWMDCYGFMAFATITQMVIARREFVCTQKARPVPRCYSTSLEYTQETWSHHTVWLMKALYINDHQHNSSTDTTANEV